jgi:hypothetical protein
VSRPSHCKSRRLIRFAWMKSRRSPFRSDVAISQERTDP